MTARPKGACWIGGKMAQRVCPWWMGPLLLSPFRRWTLNPERLLAPWVHNGMQVLEPGPGMGFFTLPLARMVGPAGHVIAIDVQPRMIDGLQHRAHRAGLAERISTRLALRDSLGIADLAGSIDFVLAFAVVHELPFPERFFREIAVVLRPGGMVLLAEPAGHVRHEKFASELEAAHAAGLTDSAGPKIRGQHTVLLRKPMP